MRSTDIVMISDRCFFDVCDGIFLNYHWNESLLRYSAFKAGARKSDVYAVCPLVDHWLFSIPHDQGIDVFGRGTFGGGGFNVPKALKAIQEAALSTGIHTHTHRLITCSSLQPSLLRAGSLRSMAHVGLSRTRYILLCIVA